MNGPTGKMFGNYRIIEEIGRGGMGVVYKAEDTKLDRLVALKFLPEHLNASGQEKARFVQEAKAASALNHPNVCTIHDIQEMEGQMFIVMEYVDGQTLRDRRGSINFKQAIDIGIQVADGLAAAHEKGIVHRDIKPDNIMIRKDGIAQIMDFGLAKLRASGSKISRLTKEGSTVGTAGYMSPEQVQGQETDHRSDIFSFGVLLYELITGQLPFKGVHDTALAYEIVNVDAAPMSSVKPDIDPSLDAIVLECLEKDPRERTQSIAQISVDLKRYRRESSRQRVSRITAARPAFSPSSSMQPQGVEQDQGDNTPKSNKLQLMLSVVLFLIAAGTLGYHFLATPKVPDRAVTRSIILPPPNEIFDVNWGGNISIAPDGSTIAYVATDTLGINHVWVRRLNSLTAIQLAGTEEARYPFWSYDSRKIGFFARGKMKNVDANGGPVMTICDASDGRGGAWNKEGVIIFAPGPTEALFRVASAGGTAAKMTEFDTTHHESSHRWPLFLPDGNHYIYTTLSAIGSASDIDVVRIGALDSSMNKVLFSATSNLAFASGYLLFIRQGTLMAQAFDPGKLEFTADAVPIAEQILYNTPYSKGMFAASQNGVLILQSGENQLQRAALFDITGKRMRVQTDVNPIEPRFSVDGRFLAFFTVDQQTRNGDVWVTELARGASSRITFQPALDIRPTWSPVGDSIIFQSNRSGIYDLYVKNSNGSGDERVLVRSNRNKGNNEWSLDGRYVSFTSSGDPKTKNDLWILPMFGDRIPIPFLQTEFNEGQGSFSPDSRWIVYSSDETGKNEIYARRVDGTGGKIQITTNGGRRPQWRSDPRKIYYSSLDRKLQVAYVAVTPASLSVDSIRALFDYESRSIVGNTVSDVSYDGKQVAAIFTESKQTAAPITLIVNWEEELKKK